MVILGWIFFGFIVGLLARAIMPGRDPLGYIGTTVLGIFGALVAGWMGQAFGWYAPDQPAGFISATIGAIIVLAIYHMIVRSRRGRHSLSGEDRIERNSDRNTNHRDAA